MPQPGARTLPESAVEGSACQGGQRAEDMAESAAGGVERRD
ncbi:hypothetical protein ACFYPN_20555 [Streptomyces sp. NPDC005576]